MPSTTGAALVVPVERLQLRRTDKRARRGARSSYEARLLSNFIRLFGEKLGQSRLIEKEVEFIGKEDVNSYPHILELQGGAV